MAKIRELAISILPENLNLGLSYLITTVPLLENPLKQSHFFQENWYMKIGI